MSRRPFGLERGLMRKSMALLLISILWTAPASAQLAVADAPVLGAISSMAGTVGSLLTVIRTMALDMKQSLQALANWPLVLQRLQLIAQLTADAQALATEIETIDAGWAELSTSGRALCSIDEAVSWKGQALQWQDEAFGVARKANRLLGRSLAVLVDMQMMLDSIIGPTSGAQSGSALLATIAGGVAQLQGLTGSFQSATLGKDVIESVMGIQLVCIHQQDYANWGTYSR
mgnify:CR=1 FL=1